MVPYFTFWMFAFKTNLFLTRYGLDCFIVSSNTRFGKYLSTASARPRTDDYIGSPCFVPYADLVLGMPGERLALPLWAL